MKTWFFQKSETEKVECAFPSLRRQRQLANLIGTDPLITPEKKFDWIGFFADESKPLEALKIILNEKVDESVLDHWSSGEVTNLVTTFFLKSVEWMPERMIEPKVLRDTIQKLMDLSHQQDTGSMSPSTTLH